MGPPFLVRIITLGITMWIAVAIQTETLPRPTESYGKDSLTLRTQIQYTPRDAYTYQSRLGSGAGTVLEATERSSQGQTSIPRNLRGSTADKHNTGSMYWYGLPRIVTLGTLLVGAIISVSLLCSMMRPP